MAKGLSVNPAQGKSSFAQTNAVGSGGRSILKKQIMEMPQPMSADAHIASVSSIHMVRRGASIVVTTVIFRTASGLIQMKLFLLMKLQSGKG